MDETRQSLLLRAQVGEEEAWKGLTDLYRPLIMGWLNRQGVPAVDLEDLSQDVLLSVVKHLPGFHRHPHPGGVRAEVVTAGVPAHARTALQRCRAETTGRVPRSGLSRGPGDVLHAHQVRQGQGQPVPR